MHLLKLSSSQCEWVVKSLVLTRNDKKGHSDGKLAPHALSYIAKTKALYVDYYSIENTQILTQNKQMLIKT